MRYGVMASACLLVAGTAQAQGVQPSAQDIRNYIANNSFRSYPERAVEAWESDLRHRLLSATPAQAANAMAARYSLAPADMRRLVAVWIVTQAHHYDLSKDGQAPVRRELLALIPTVRRMPIGLTLLAEAMSTLKTGTMGGTGECPAETFAALMAGAQDKALDAYHIASAAPCAANFARAALAAPDRAMPILIRFAHYGALPPRDALPLYAWLTSPAALARIAEPDRRALSVLLWQRYLTALLDAGQDTQALSLYDGLSPDLRAAILSPDYRPPESAVVDGIPVSFLDAKGSANMTAVAAADDAPVSMAATDDLEAAADMLEAVANETAKKPKSGKHAPTLPPLQPARPVELVVEAASPPTLSLAMAMAAAGREDEARALLKALPDLEAARSAAARLYDPTPDDRTPMANRANLPMDALILDHLLNRPADDPYPIAETVLAVGHHGAATAASAAVTCRVFPAAGYPGLCDDARKGISGLDDNMGLDADDAMGSEVLARIVPDFVRNRAALVSPAPSPRADVPSTTIAAPSSPFVERPIPADRRGPSTAPAPKGLAKLPPGYQLVRAERSGQRVVAISLSQTLDPTGEVSGGGYWVHVSDDGGRHWQAPLYTGLADRFPYVVVPSSRLPLIDGDTIQLAVEVAEIDTASITYPPVGLRTRRRATGLYLTIPLADLARDSDGDGWTDIAAHHLLLDRPKAPGATPFVVGSDAGTDCTVAPSPERSARIGLLSKLIDPSGNAIVEPVDRPAGEILTGISRASAATDQPLFLIGRAEDYACLRSRRPIIVYSAEDEAALKRFTPDFHGFTLPPIVFNRARDRGYVQWSAGWAGGTYRLRRVNGRWEYDTISSWIT